MYKVDVFTHLSATLSPKLSGNTLFLILSFIFHVVLVLVVIVIRLLHGYVVWRRWSSLCCLSSNTANHSSTFVNNNKKKGLNSELWARRTDQVLPDSKTKEWTAGVAVVIPACKWNALVRTQAFLKEQKGNHKMWHHFGIFFFPFPGTAWLIGK